MCWRLLFHFRPAVSACAKTLELKRKVKSPASVKTRTGIPRGKLCLDAPNVVRPCNWRRKGTATTIHLLPGSVSFCEAYWETVRIHPACPNMSSCTFGGITCKLQKANKSTAPLRTTRAWKQKGRESRNSMKMRLCNACERSFSTLLCLSVASSAASKVKSFLLAAMLPQTEGH